MSDYKPITGELRNVYTQTDAYNTVFHTDEFERCCDAIDAIHAGLEAENERLKQDVAMCAESEQEKCIAYLRKENIDWEDKYREIAKENTNLREQIDTLVIYVEADGTNYSVDDDGNQHFDHSNTRTSDGWMELPKDADGEYIHEHDKVDWRDHAGTWHENATVVAVCNDGCYVMDGTVFHVHKSDVRHHHALTVEDVLLEFAHVGIRIAAKHGIKAGEFDFYADDEAIVKYAKRLQLKEDA